MALTSGTKFGPYEIVAPAGAGGMGEVYRARDIRLDRTVAIKVLADHLESSPDLKQRFEREARAISSLNHPNICHLYDVGSQDGIDYLVMEYVEGETLAARLQRGALPLDQVLKLGTEIGEALDKAHRSGFIHRDLKPGNIMLTKNGAKLLDFGLAKTSPAIAGKPPTPLSPSNPTMTVSALVASAPESLTRKGTVLGTFQYMAPEVLQGTEADTRSDIFSYGCVLYEMTTGRPAFTGKSQLSVLTAILESDPPPIAASQPLAPLAFDFTVRTCLAKNPDERWQSAADVVRNLHLARSTMSAQPLTTAKTKVVLYVLTAACAVLAAALLWVGFLTRQRETSPPQLGRFSFTTPNNAPPFDIAVSQDGRQIAFTSGGTVWVRALDSDTPRKLPDTLGARYAFWSPDGHSLAFFTGLKLKRISVSDASVQDICEIGPNQPAGGSWNPDNVILFGTYGGPIMRVPASGGEPAPVLQLDGQRKEFGQAWPAFLPDGHHFTFASMIADFGLRGNNREIDIGDLSGSRRQLLGRNSNAEYANGYLLYVRDGALVAQPFDPESAKFGGEPMLLEPNIAFHGIFAHGEFSVSPKVLAHFPVQREVLHFVGRSGGQLGQLGAEGAISSVDVSPDGKLAVIERTNPQNGNGELWLLDVGRQVSSRLTTDDAAWGWAPIFSPDGTKVIFSSTRSGISDIYEHDIASGSEHLVLGHSQRLAPLDVSADGKYLLYEVLAPSTRNDIWELPLNAGAKPAPYIETKYVESGARFSPDGRWTAYCSDESGAMEVYVQSFPVPRQKSRISTSGGCDVRWRRDGRELYFVSVAGDLMAVPVTTTGTFNAGVPKPLFHVGTLGSMARRGYWPSPDGQRFLVLTESSDTVPQITVVMNWTEALKK
jgi:eukaryotic-like serine/threonine-protein kinase